MAIGSQEVSSLAIYPVRTYQHAANGPYTQLSKTDLISLTGAAPASATVGATDAEIVAANSSRAGLVITNLSANRVFLGIGQAAEANKGIALVPNGTWNMNEWSFSTAAIHAIASGAGSAISIQEFTLA